MTFYRLLIKNIDHPEVSVYSENTEQETAMKFLKTKWRNLMMANYEVDEKFLDSYIPSGCELDLYKGRALVSVVAFEFSDTSLCGIPMPFYRNFPEINLRIYVKRIVAGEWRRGVVFIKEIIPHRFPAWIARTVFRENFHVMPVSIEMTDHHINYNWGEGNVLAGKLGNELKDWQEGTEEKFIGDNFWAFKKVDEQKTLEFKVTHQPWKMRFVKDIEVSFDFATLYGKEFATAIEENGGKPTSVFYVDGSQVEVTIPRKV
ncbi:MAG: hypothetical protein ACI9E1_000136 [Cryomorphaceae bacterium]